MNVVFRPHPLTQFLCNSQRMLRMQRMVDVYCPPGSLSQLFCVDIGDIRLRWSRGSVLAFSTQVRGFKPGRRRRIFRAKKSSARLSLEGEVKPSVPCCRFAACKRYLNLRGSRNLGKITGNFLAHSSTFRC